jgi:hypothetical protein
MSAIGRFVAACLAVAAVTSCGLTPAPSGPCLEALPEIANLEYDRIDRVELDIQGDTEVVRFVFDPADRGFGSVTAEPGQGPFVDAAFEEPVTPMGDRLTSIKFEGLTGVGQADRLRADPTDGAPVREVVQVADRNVTRFIVGTVAGACLRLRVDPKQATVALLASPR